MEVKLSERVRIVCSSGTTWLDVIQGVAEDFGERSGLDEEGRFSIAMALRESVNNAIIHGNRRDRGKQVEVELEHLADRIEIRVRDQGPGFDSTRIADPLAPENLLKPGGRGIFLIRHYMDRVDLKRASRSGGEIRMTKWLARGGASGTTPVRGQA